VNDASCDANRFSLGPLLRWGITLYVSEEGEKKPKFQPLTSRVDPGVVYRRPPDDPLTNHPLHESKQDTRSLQ
jgi:hypothetical protein